MCRLSSQTPLVHPADWHKTCGIWVSTSSTFTHHFFANPLEQRVTTLPPQGALSNTCTGNGSHPEVDKVLGSIVTWQLQCVYMLKNNVHLVLLPNIYLHILLVPCNYLKFSDLPEIFKEVDVCLTCVGRPLMAVQSTVA